MKSASLPGCKTMQFGDSLTFCLHLEGWRVGQARNQQKHVASWAKLAACQLQLVSHMAYISPLKMELTCYPKMSGSLWTAWRYNKEDCALFLLVNMLVFFTPVRVHSVNMLFQVSSVLFSKFCCLWNYSSIINSSLVSQSERKFCPHKIHLVNWQNLGTQMFNFYSIRVLYVDVI
jgi:hypothetical protein